MSRTFNEIFCLNLTIKIIFWTEKNTFHNRKGKLFGIVEHFLLRSELKEIILLYSQSPRKQSNGGIPVAKGLYTDMGENRQKDTQRAFILSPNC
jgi:hypothetical protein